MTSSVNFSITKEQQREAANPRKRRSREKSDVFGEDISEVMDEKPEVAIDALIRRTGGKDEDPDEELVERVEKSIVRPTYKSRSDLPTYDFDKTREDAETIVTIFGNCLEEVSRQYSQSGSDNYSFIQDKLTPIIKSSVKKSIKWVISSKTGVPGSGDVTVESAERLKKSLNSGQKREIESDLMNIMDNVADEVIIEK